MLPDLWRMAHPRVRARSGARSPAEPDDRSSSLASGIEHHLAVDAWFHRTEVFRAGEHALATAFAALGVVKLPLFAHVAWEMCLDGAWMRRAPGLEELRKGWQRAGEAIVSLADQHGALRLEADERARFHDRVGAMREGLVEGSWPRGYATAEGLVERLDGMRTRRFGMPPLAHEARREVARSFRAVASEADRGVSLLMAEREALASERGHSALDWSWAR